MNKLVIESKRIVEIMLVSEEESGCKGCGACHCHNEKGCACHKQEETGVPEDAPNDGAPEEMEMDLPDSLLRLLEHAPVYLSLMMDRAAQKGEIE